MHDHCAYIPYVLLRASHPTESNRNESQRRPFFENLSFNFLTILFAAMESICSRENAGHVEKRRYYRRRTRVKQSVGNFLAILRGITRPGQRTHGLRAIVIGYVSSCSFLVFQRNVTRYANTFGGKFFEERRCCPVHEHRESIQRDLCQRVHFTRLHFPSALVPTMA